MPLSDFRSVLRFQVPFHDIDMMQHVNNASYVVWAETARCVYFDEVMGGGALNGREGIILAKIEVTYERPLNYREKVAVASRVTRLGTKSFELLCEMWSEDTDQRSAICTAVLVAYDYGANTSITIPPVWRERILAFEAIAPTV